jgi:hypothetical protein
MAIEVDCECGESFRVTRDSAGAVRCPYCDEAVLVPAKPAVPVRGPVLPRIDAGTIAIVALVVLVGGSILLMPTALPPSWVTPISIALVVFIMKR